MTAAQVDLRETPRPGSPPLPEPAPRRRMHTRRIHLDGYCRDDGLWDIEARIVDTKAYPYVEPYRGRRDPGSHVHDMMIRLTLDASLVVRAVAVAMPDTPYEACAGAAAAFQRLVGASVGAGWRRQVNEAVGGVLGCTHVRELLMPMATVAFQTIIGWPEADVAVQSVVKGDPDAAPRFVNGCHAWAEDGKVMADLHPEHYRAKRTRD